MNKLKQLYSISISDSSLGLEEATKRKEAYAEYKMNYKIKCKEERIEKYSFWQRNKIQIGTICLLVIIMIPGSFKYFTGDESVESEYESDEVVDSISIIGDEKNEDMSIIDERSVNEEPPVTTDSFTNADGQRPIQEDIKEDIKVGMEVNFIGSIHYESSYSAAPPIKCSSGKAIITRINENEAHPYHLESCEESCTVYGWVNIEDIELLGE